jgi:hypothetical protein
MEAQRREAGLRVDLVFNLSRSDLLVANGAGMATSEACVKISDANQRERSPISMS